MDNSVAVTEWLNSIKSKKTKSNYTDRWKTWIEYCRAKGLLTNGDAQLADMKKRRLSTDNTVKYFYDNEVPKFYNWLRTEFRGKKTNKPLAESSALATTTAVRSFFSHHRYSLEIQKDALPSSEKIENKYVDHAFDIYQLRSMYQCGDLKERTILATGVNLALRSGDFLSLNRDQMKSHLSYEFLDKFIEDLKHRKT